MESVGHVTVPLRVGGKKMRKRRELDALVAHSLAKSSGKRHIAGNGIASHDQLLSNSTDEQEDYSWQPKVRAQSRCRRKRFSCLRTCGPLLLVSCIFLSLGFMYWLYFDIRQQVSEYRIRIEQVSASSQNLPEALQRWHETSKTLEQNQTALNGKLREVQQVLSNFSAELKQLRDTIEKKNENSQEAQLNSLKTNVADIGSKIGDAIARISALEERYAVTTTDQKTVRKSVDELQTLIAQIRNGSAPASTNSATNNATEQSIANIREELSTQIANLAQNFTTELETLNQKNSWLDKDLKSHKTSIDQLVENSANISSHVKSVENIWVEMKNNLTYLDSGTRQIYNQLEMLQNATNGLKGSISSVREECDHYHAQNDVIANEISSIKTRLEKAEKKVIPATVPTTIATGPPKDPLSQLFNKPTESTASKPSQSAREQNSHQGVFPESQQAGKQASVAQQQPSASPPSTSAITTTTTLTSNSQNLKSDATYNGM
ncbi:uncharacterized protein LOC129764285 isoform X1 [Toxorhynchites rutilus septentrionalis]|uniref:uncharacterized protein LOC129764285 isoform X1 n=1 Tax=Toxorhynchites rutilus septentrionalis TaxID=329112 RepID=UPI0024790264|nr:uncharacterized protein LOC129764285 isoform X1 [Toxorhynchites rutilus septentrionalis]XP_055619180.1 uncharacterized protein LOC129764285 isoform X1 [Toxorhynchites rutilus septentrionalis]XP_055619181.1 uncharacterized protein LOC129764285 isoform X1 [Toxorhynchites rutilus septentrionalis]